MEESPIGKQNPETPSESQRRDERDSLFVLAQLRHEGASEANAVTVRVRNVSSGGLMADAPHEYRSGARVEVKLEGIGMVAGLVAWAESGRIGISFDHPIDKARARKPVAKQIRDDLMKPVTDFRRPPVKPL